MSHPIIFNQEAVYQPWDLCTYMFPSLERILIFFLTLLNFSALKLVVLQFPGFAVFYSVIAICYKFAHHTSLNTSTKSA